MKLDFWRFPSISCQARHWWVMFNRFSFPLGYVSFCCLNHLTKNVRGVLLHHVCSNPLTPDSSTSGAVTLISKGQTTFIMFPLFPHTTLVSTMVSAAHCSGEPLFSPCPEVNAGAEGRLCAGLALTHPSCQSCTTCKITRFLTYLWEGGGHAH